MAVRIQFRRGTAAEWTSANPTLAAGELGYETDTTKFKLGDGTTDWTTLDYAGVTQADIEAAVEGVVGLAPSDLDTIAELANAIGNDPTFITTVGSNLDTHIADSTNIHGIADTSALETKTGAQTKATNAQANAAAYTDNAIANLIASAPGTLDTLNELAAALGDDPNYATTVTTALAGKLSFVIDTATNLSNANAVTTANTIYIESDTNRSFARVGDGITHYNDLAFLGKDYADEVLAAHSSLDTDVHGISDTANLAYQVDIANALAATEDVANSVTTLTSNLSTHASDTTDIHGIANTAELVTTTQLTSQVTTAIASHNENTQNVHGIANTAELVVQSDLTAHADTTLDVHGISNTANLVYLADLEMGYAPLAGPTFSGTVVLPSTTSIGDVSAADLATLANVTSDIQAQIDGKLASSTASTTYAPIASPTFTGAVALPADTTIGDVSATELGYIATLTSNAQTQIDAKAPINSPTFTGTVSGVTKAMVGLGNVDNTADADKPISDDTQAALDLKADLSGATFSGDVTVTGDFTVTGNTITVNTTSFTTTDPLIYLGEGNEGNTADLGFVANFNDGTYQHTGLVRDSSAGTWKLFKGVTDEPTATVNFGQGSLDNLAANNISVAGVVFTDGTQTKVGVPSISEFTYKTASYTLDSLSLRDGIIEVSNTSATTITIPAEADVNYPIGSSIDIIQTNTGQVTIAGAGGVTVNSTPGLKLRTRWSSATLLKRAADTWIVYGDLTA